MDIDIDASSHKRQIIHEALEQYFRSIGGDIVKVCTFKTETAKSAILTSFRGLGLNSDEASYVASLVPNERGQLWSIEDCYYGNEEKERKPIQEFKNTVDKYPRLLETMLSLAGIISARGVHPCGILVVNKDISNWNACMKAPNGDLTTQYSLGDSETTGLIKYDLLSTKAEGIIQTALELLIEAGHIKWNKTLRDTYNQSIHPDVLDYVSTDMWGVLNRGELIQAFQMDGAVGEQAVRMIQPTDILQVSQANTVMRLSTDDEEQPLERYARYKHDLEEWYKDMANYGLTQDEVEILETHLLHDFGVCGTQESLMAMTLDERISGFNVPEANFIRKIIAKKKMKEIPKAKQLFYDKGLALGNREVFLDYIWNEQFSLQLGYAFCLAHSLEYSLVLLQQLNLVHHYPSIYYNTAVLQVESGSLEQAELETEDDEDDASSNKKEKMTNYGVIATAISMLQKRGIKIDLPDINKAQLRFVPDEVNNSILFGLKGITKINTETAKTIIENRPYTSFNDFKERLVETKREVIGKDGKVQNKAYVTNAQLVSLIKAGAFDSLEAGKTREDILYDYIKSIYEPKKSMSAKMIQHILELGFVPEDLMEQIRHYHFREFIKKLPNYKDETSKSIKWHVIETGTQEMNDYTTNYFETHFMLDLTEDKDYRFDENGRVQIALGTKRKGSFEDIYTQKTKELSDWLKSDDCLGRYNRMLLDELMIKHADGTKEKWEMESMSLYRETHECDNLRLDGYNIAQFDNLSEEPTIIGYNAYRNVQYPKFALSTLVGTVLDKDNNKHSITLLTQSGVVNIKFQAGQFNHYAKTISVINPETGKKTTVEESWFKKGKILFVTGYRSGQIFRAKVYKGGIVEHTVQLINRINEDGTFVVSPERARMD